MSGSFDYRTSNQPKPVTPISFVDPAEVAPTYRVLLWAAPGEGKSVGACSAPGPILVLSADRPTAYRFARRHHRGKDIREVRYVGQETLEQVYRYVVSPEGQDVKTIVVDPVSHIVDSLVDVAPRAKDGGADYQWINSKVLRFIKSFRPLDINVVLIAHEKVNDGKKGDGKLYPAVGGATLINKVCAEMDIVAHVSRVVRQAEGEEPEPVWIGQLQPAGSPVCKDGTGVLGDRRVLDLTRWFDLANEALADSPGDAEKAAIVAAEQAEAGAAPVGTEA